MLFKQKNKPNNLQSVRIKNFIAIKPHETLELLDIDKSGIHIASYWTEALPKAELEHKLHEAVMLARARMKGMPGQASKLIRLKFKLPSWKPSLDPLSISVFNLPK